MRILFSLLTLFAFLLAPSVSAQTTRIVDNTIDAPDGDHIYTELQDAVDASEAGDVIYITPSQESYGDVVIDRKLSVYGLGFNPEKDVPDVSSVANITISTAEASVSKFRGLMISSVRVEDEGAFAVDYTVEDLLFERNEIGNLSSHTSVTLDGLILRNNLLRGVNLGGVEQNVRIENNIILLTANWTVFGKFSNKTRVSNNLFLLRSSGHALTNCSDIVVMNNLFYGAKGIASGVTRSVFTNNLSYGSTNHELPPEEDGTNSGSGNIVQEFPKFVDAPAYNEFSTFQYSWDFSLEDDSPAKGAGFNGDDIGPTGGAAPFLFPYRGTVLPLIQKLNTAGTASQGSALHVEVKAAGN